MSERLPSWERIARTMAKRLHNHAFCERHPESNPEESCPYCEDRAAYRLYQRKAGVRGTGPLTAAVDAAPAVSLDEMLARTAEEKKALGINWVGMPCGHAIPAATEVPLAELRCPYLCDLTVTEIDE